MTPILTRRIRERRGGLYRFSAAIMKSRPRAGIDKAPKIIGASLGLLTHKYPINANPTKMMRCPSKRWIAKVESIGTIA
jgi:hypothetical protein